MIFSDELFLLVKSLSGPEKRYFRLFAGLQARGKQKGYLILFDELDRQNRFDEEALRKKLAGAPFINRFSAAKSYLFNLLLRSLRNFHAGNDVDAALQTLLDNARVLFKKGLVRKAQKTATKGKVLALNSERFLHALPFIHLLHELILDDFPIREGGLLSDVLDREREDVLRKLSNLGDYEQLRLRMRLETVRFPEVIKGRHKTEALNRIMKHPLMSGSGRALSFRASIQFYATCYMYYSNINQYQKAIENNLALLNAFTKRPGMLADHFSEYMGVLRGITYCCGKTRDYELAADAMARQRTAVSAIGGKRLDNRDNISAMATFQHSEMHVYLRTCEFEKARQTAEGLMAFMQRYRRWISKDFHEVHVYNSALVYFIAGDFSRALSYVNTLLNLGSKSVRPDVFSATMVLNLLIHFERGNEIYLLYALRSTYRHFYARSNGHKTEGAILRFIKQTTGLTDRVKLRPHFKKLSNELARLDADPGEHAYLEATFLMPWIRSRISGRTMREELVSEYTAATA